MDASDFRTKDQTEVSAEFLRCQLLTAFDRVWKTSLPLPLTRIENANADFSSEPWLGAEAWIGGSWTGGVRVGMPKKLARKISSLLLNMAEPNDEQVDDVLRELANMTAGNLKSVLPQKCGLATPGNFEIRSLETSQDGFAPLMVSWYESEGDFLFVSIHSLHDFAESRSVR